MSSVPEQLRQADPLSGDMRALDAARGEMRRRVIAGATRPALDPPARGRRAALLALSAAAAAVVVAGGTALWSGSATVVAAVRFEVRLGEAVPASGLKPMPVAGTGRTVYLHDDVILTNGDILRTEVTEDTPPGRFAINVVFTPAGREKMRAATTSHMGRPLAILLDGQVVLAPVIRSVIADSAMITGDYTRAEAERIAEGLRLQ